MKIAIYVASPSGFSESMGYFYQGQFLPMLNRLQQRLGEGYEVEVLDPWSEGGMPETLDQAMDIGRANDDALMHANVVVAILDHQDTGTAGEVGASFIRGHLIMGYYSDFRPAGDAACLTVNLQVEYYIRESGGDIARTLEELETMLVNCIKAKYPLTK